MQRVELERQQTIFLFPLGDSWMRKDGKPLLSLYLYFRLGGGTLSMLEFSLLILGLFLLLAAPF